MGSFGGYYKGDKKKQKKDSRGKARANPTVFAMPKIISKKKKDF